MKQREMPILGEPRKPDLAPLELVGKCKNGMDAIRLCIQLSGLAYETICDRLGIDKGHWTRILQGRAHFPTAKRVDLMRLCGNFAPLQFEASECGFELQEKAKDQRIRELEAELVRLKEAV